MLDTKLYNEAVYNEADTNSSEAIYNNSQTGVDFGAGFKIPNSFINNCMIRYLKPLSSEYDVNRRTGIETDYYNIRKTDGGIEISGRIKGDSREQLLNNIDYFKSKVNNKQQIIIKDHNIEKIAKVFIEDIEFDENHYNLTFMNFTIIISFRDLMSLNKTNSIKYKDITENNKEFTFENPGKETHYIAVLEYETADNLEVVFNVNGVDLIIEGVNSGDIISIDTNNIKVEKNNQELVFGGIVSKLKEKDNIIKISDNGSAREYDFNLYYKKTLY